MSIADSIFKPHLPDFGKILIIERCSNDRKTIFWYSKWYKKCQKSVSLFIQLISTPDINLMTLNLKVSEKLFQVSTNKLFSLKNKVKCFWIYLHKFTCNWLNLNCKYLDCTLSTGGIIFLIGILKLSYYVDVFNIDSWFKTWKILRNYKKKSTNFHSLLIVSSKMLPFKDFRLYKYLIFLIC